MIQTTAQAIAEMMDLRGQRGEVIPVGMGMIMDTDTTMVVGVGRAKGMVEGGVRMRMRRCLSLRVEVRRGRADSGEWETGEKGWGLFCTK